MSQEVFSLLPTTVIKYAFELGDELHPPSRQRFNSVALFADVSGFTNLSESLAKRGPQGAEELAFFLNRYMEQLVRYIARAGGDVFKFAGDAMLVLWYPNLEEGEDEEAMLRVMAHRAVQCSLQIQEEMDEAHLTEDVALSVKIGIGVGSANILHVGGLFNRIEFLACGNALMQAFAAEEHSEKGMVVSSPEIWELVSEAFESVPRGDGFVQLLTGKRVRNQSVNSNASFMRSDLAQTQRILSRYIPAAMKSFLTASPTSATWLGELRMITVLFINMGLDLSNIGDVQDEKLSMVQNIILSIQKGVYRYEGSLNKLLVDDKGSNLIAVFGVPPMAHSNDPVRGLLSALKLLSELQALDVACYIGVTTGIVYTGVLGTRTAREYGVLGDAVNLSARLMAKVKYTKVSGVICSQITRQLTPPNAPIKFNTMDPFFVKGKNDKIFAFEPRYAQEPVEAYEPPVSCFNVAQDASLEKVDNIISECVEGRSTVILISSGEGMGKTHFLGTLHHELSQIGWHVVWGRGNKYFESSPDKYLAWKMIFEQILGKGKYSSCSAYQTHVKGFFKTELDLAQHLHLANPIFGSEFHRPADVEALDDVDSAEKLRDICVHILQHVADLKKLALVLDQLENITQSDWILTEFFCNLALVSNQLSNVILLLACRPLTSILYKPRFAPIPNEFKRISKMLPHANVISLRNWNMLDVQRFLCDFFAVDDINPFLTAFVFERSGGIPAVCAHLADTLPVCIGHSGGIAILNPSPHLEYLIFHSDPVQFGVPAHVHATIMEFVDRLDSKQIILLKTASAICMGQGASNNLFSSGILEEAYPLDSDSAQIDSDLQVLVKCGILRSEEFLNFDLKDPTPNVFIHNYDWLTGAPLLACMMQICSHVQTDETPLLIWQSALVHLHANRIMSFSVNSDDHVDWSLPSVLVLSDSQNRIEVSKKSKDAFTITHNRILYHFKCTEQQLPNWLDAIDISSSAEVPAEMESVHIVPAEGQMYSFMCGFFRDVMYGLMLKKHHHSLHSSLENIFKNKKKEQANYDTPFIETVIERHKYLSSNDPPSLRHILELMNDPNTF